MLDKAEYSAFESTLNSPIVSYRICLQCGWLEVQIHEKDVLKCSTTDSGELCVMMGLIKQQQESFATRLGSGVFYSSRKLHILVQNVDFELTFIVTDIVVV